MLFDKDARDSWRLMSAAEKKEEVGAFLGFLGIALFLLLVAIIGGR